MSKMLCRISAGPHENPNENWDDRPARDRLSTDINIQISRLTKHNAVDFQDLVDVLKRAGDYIDEH